MARSALGMIETIGLAAAIEAADTAVKSANVELVGYELSKGGGMVTVKLVGDVGAVKAAVEAACVAAQKVNQVWSKQVIPRPHDEIEALIYTPETIGISQKQPIQSVEQEEEIDNQEQHTGCIMVKEKWEEGLEETEDEDDMDEGVDFESEDGENEEEKQDEEVCNLCTDPQCPRRKGELKSHCIHYDEIKGGHENG